MAKTTFRKRSLVEDPPEILSLQLRLLQYLKDYWKWVAAGLVLLFIALAAWGVMSQLQARRQEQAGAALARIIPQLSKPEAGGGAIKALDQLVKDYPGTSSALEAAILRAHLLYQTKQYGDAAKAYEALIHGPGANWSPLLVESLSYCYEAQGDFRKAAQTLKPVAEKVSGPFQNEIYRRLALLLEKGGEFKEAGQYWQKMLEINRDPALVAYFKEKAAAADAASRKK